MQIALVVCIQDENLVSLSSKNPRLSAQLSQFLSDWSGQVRVVFSHDLARVAEDAEGARYCLFLNSQAHVGFNFFEKAIQSAILADSDLLVPVQQTLHNAQPTNFHMRIDKRLRSMAFNLSGLALSTTLVNRLSEISFSNLLNADLDRIEGFEGVYFDTSENVLRSKLDLDLSRAPLVFNDFSKSVISEAIFEKISKASFEHNYQLNEHDMGYLQSVELPLDKLLIEFPYRDFEIGLLNYLRSGESKFPYKKMPDRTLFYRYGDSTNSFSDQILEVDTSGGGLRVGLDRYVPIGKKRRFLSVFKQPVLLFMDRPHAAGDNAEILYAFMMKQKRSLKLFFALSAASADYGRLKKLGFNLVEPFTEEYYDVLEKSDLFISSHIYPTNWRRMNFRNRHFLFLQHGITLNDPKEMLLRAHFDWCVTSVVPEQTIVEGVAPGRSLPYTMPRFSRSIPSRQEICKVVFAPTWRKNLVGVDETSFFGSRYAQGIEEILTDADFLSLFEQNGIELLFKPHPSMGKNLRYFSESVRKKITNFSYEELYQEADLFITDYSSAVLDARFYGKRVVYYQWDRDSFFKEQNFLTPWDYEQFGIGPVCYERESLIDEIRDILGGREDRYAKRTSEFFRGSAGHTSLQNLSIFILDFCESLR